MSNLELDLNNICAGDIFFVELKNLCGINISSKYASMEEEYKIEDNNFPHSLVIKNEFIELDNDNTFSARNEEIRTNCLTMVKYLGNGLFLEYFTGITIGYQDFQEEIKVPAWENFMWAYNEYIKTPLLIKTGKLMPVTDEVRYKFIDSLKIDYNPFTKKQISNIEDIKSTIYLMNSISYTDMEEKRIAITYHDEAFAYSENMIRNLEKMI